MYVIDKFAPPPYTESQSNYISNSEPPPYTPSDVSIISIQTPPANIPQSIIIAEPVKNDRACGKFILLKIICYMLFIILIIIIASSVF
ncbi:hypothetical protein CAJAP_05009 [Camponotus japonicus]